MVFLYGAGEFPNYCAALEKIGQRILISQDVCCAENCQGLLLPGGGDIHGKLDAQESAAIRFFVTHRLPILGICRGLQALNVYFGGTLYDFIPNHQDLQGDITHATHAAGLIASLLGDVPVVNSNHHQAIKGLGAGLIACQWAQDGILEAVQHQTLPVLGVQWHPERWKSGDAVFRWFARELRK